MRTANLCGRNIAPAGERRPAEGPVRQGLSRRSWGAPGEYDLISGTINLTGSAIDGAGILVPIENNLFYTGGGTQLFNFTSPAGGNNWASGLANVCNIARP